jgi:hypothetical protein
MDTSEHDGITRDVAPSDDEASESDRDQTRRNIERYLADNVRLARQLKMLIHED